MKHLTKLTILTAIFAVALLCACKKEGPEGKQGKQGEKGEKGDKGEQENLLTVTFIFDNGTAQTTQKVINGGWAVKPETPTPAKEYDVAGLYAGAAPQYAFDNWYKTGETTPFNFASPVTANMTLTAKWTASATPINIAGQTGNNILTKAINYANANPAEYTLLLDADVAAGEQYLFTSTFNLKLNIIGIGAERTITYNGDASNSLFYISTSITNITLGQNITIKGIPNGTGNLITIWGGSFTMLAGSKITGHTTSAFFHSTVYVEGAGAVFNMQGGEISGNRTTNGESLASGGVLVTNDATFNMSGGVIKDNTSAFNTSSPADVFIVQEVEFNLSGAAAINALILNAVNSIDIASINITSAYSGKVDKLHLRGGDANLNTVINWCVGKTIITGATADIVSKFTLGDFRNDGTATQSISASHRINNSGVLVAN